MSGPQQAVVVDGSGLRVAIVAARFNEDICKRLVEGAVEALRACKVDDADLAVHWVPGAFELPVVAGELARRDLVDAVVAIGCIIRGDTPHFEYVADACTTGCEAVAREHGVPVGFGVLTTEDLEQAEVRAGGAMGNKGWDAALAAVETARLLEQL